MARVKLAVDTPEQRMTLQAMLEAAGHKIVDSSPEVIFAESTARARREQDAAPIVLLATASEVPAAIEAMRDGVYGYVFVPLQPDEAPMMVDRVLGSPRHAEAASGKPEEWPTLEAFEIDYIERVLRTCKHNQARAARILGIGRNTLWRKLKKYRNAGGK